MPLNQPSTVANIPDCGPGVCAAILEFKNRCGKSIGGLALLEDEEELHREFFKHLRDKMGGLDLPLPSKKERARFTGILESRKHIDIVCGNVAIELKYKPRPFNYPEIGKVRQRKDNPKFERKKHVDDVRKDIDKMRRLIENHDRSGVDLGYAVVLTSREFTDGAEEALKAVADLKEHGKWSEYKDTVTRYFIFEVRKET